MNIKSQVKIDKIVEIEGYDDEMDALHEATHDSIAPGICFNDKCNYTQAVEPDCHNGYCPSCGTHTLKSILILKGIM